MGKIYSRWIGRKINRLHVAILALILTSLILRIPILLLRCFCPDEFQHLHATRSLVHGMVPYRDFFEHHTPFLYFLLAPVYAIVGDSISMLFYSWGVMLLFTGGITYLVYKLGKMVYGADTGWIGALFVAYNLMFMDKTIETRPDLPGMVFWLLTLIFLIQGMRCKQRRYYLLSGTSIALAILCTPKMLFGGIGLFLAALWLLIDKRTGNTLKESVRAFAWMAVGVAIPSAVTCIYFGVNQGLDDFIYRNFTMNLRWRHRNSLGATWSYWLYNVARNPFFSVFSFTGLAIASYRLKSKNYIVKGGFCPRDRNLRTHRSPFPDSRGLWTIFCVLSHPPCYLFRVDRLDNNELCLYNGTQGDAEEKENRFRCLRFDRHSDGCRIGLRARLQQAQTSLFVPWWQ